MIAADSSAIFAILNDEPTADALELCAAAAGVVYASMPTRVETGIVVSQRLGSSGMDRLLHFAEIVNLVWIDFDGRQADLAIGAYRRFGRGSGSPARLNFGDCFSYALAKSLDLPLLYIGDDFVHTDVRSALSRP